MDRKRRRSAAGDLRNESRWWVHDRRDSRGEEQRVRGEGGGGAGQPADKIVEEAGYGHADLAI